MRWLVAALVAALQLLAICVPARGEERGGQLERSRQLVRTLTQEATAAFARKELDKAQQLLEAAYLLFSSGKIQYSLGRVYEAQSKPLLAMVAYQRFLRQVPPAERLPGQSEDVNEAVKRLTPLLGHIVIIGDPSVQYRLDDGPAQTLNPADAWVEPGQHRLVFFEGTVENVVIKAGATAMLHAPPPEPAPARLVTSPPPPPPRVNKVRVFKWLLGSVGLATLAAGISLWAIDGKLLCTPPADQTTCYPRLASRYPGIGLVAGGGVLLVASAALFGYDAGYSAGQKRVAASPTALNLNDLSGPGLALEY